MNPSKGSSASMECWMFPHSFPWRKKLGLYVIVRPGPYICAEWEFGGLPAWLLAGKFPGRTEGLFYPPGQFQQGLCDGERLQLGPFLEQRSSNVTVFALANVEREK